jgi:hypothetical protein
MLWNGKPGESEKLTPWVIGAFGLIVFAIAAYINYGDTWFPKHANAQPATVATDKPSDPGH